jgi:hypothetical protein
MIQSLPFGSSQTASNHLTTDTVDHTPLVTAPSTVVDIIREAIGEALKG